MNDLQRTFLDKATAEATKASHPFPQMAAAEAALESNWGNSELARAGSNLFGMKQHAHELYGTMRLPTREFEGEEWISVDAAWIVYPDWATCFVDRLSTLKRLSVVLNRNGTLEYPHYKAALEATAPEQYITEVSQTWSTDPLRAQKCLSIYQEYVQPSA